MTLGESVTPLHHNFISTQLEREIIVLQVRSQWKVVGGTHLITTHGRKEPHMSKRIVHCVAELGSLGLITLNHPQL